MKEVISRQMQNAEKYYGLQRHCKLLACEMKVRMYKTLRPNLAHGSEKWTLTQSNELRTFVRNT